LKALDSLVTQTIFGEFFLRTIPCRFTDVLLVILSTRHYLGVHSLAISTAQVDKKPSRLPSLLSFWALFPSFRRNPFFFFLQLFISVFVIFPVPDQTVELWISCPRRSPAFRNRTLPAILPDSGIFHLFCDDRESDSPLVSCIIGLFFDVCLFFFFTTKIDRSSSDVESF